MENVPTQGRRAGRRRSRASWSKESGGGLRKLRWNGYAKELRRWLTSCEEIWERLEKCSGFLLRLTIWVPSVGGRLPEREKLETANEIYQLSLRTDLLRDTEKVSTTAERKFGGGRKILPLTGDATHHRVQTPAALPEREKLGAANKPFLSLRGRLMRFGQGGPAD